MSVDITKTLQASLNSTKDAIKITPASLGSAFGQPIETAITEIFSGSISIGGATFQFTPGSPPEASAKISGSGTAAPLLGGFEVDASFTATGTKVTLEFSGKITSTYKVSEAWSALNVAPFNELSLSSGSADLTVKPGDQSFDLKVIATASYGSTALAEGLFIAKYKDNLSFLGGFVISDNWTPSSDFPALKGLSINVDAAVFFSDLASETSLKGLFDSLTNKPAYLPDSIAKGLTFAAGIELAGTLSPIKQLLPAGTTLGLEGNVQAKTLKAILTEPVTHGAFNFQKIEFDWDEPKSQVALLVSANFDDEVILVGTLTFVYDPAAIELSGELELEAGSKGNWKPFPGIDFEVKALDVGLELAVTEEQLSLDIGATFDVGASPGVEFSVAAGVATGPELAMPSFLFFEASNAADKNKPITLPEFVGAFLPSIQSDLNKMPIIGGDNIKFTDITIFAATVETPFEGHTYEPGAGATGKIEFFDSFELDFGFSFVASPKPAIKAKGTISDGTGGPIIVKSGQTTILKLSDVSGKLGPSACIDTSGSGFCNTGSAPKDSYFVIDAAVDLLGLSASVYAYAAKTSFAFDVSLGAGNIFSSELACAFDPSAGNLNAAAILDFTPPNITVPAFGPIPSFEIPTPKLQFGVALGTQLPPFPLPSPLKQPTKPDYFQVYFKIEFAGLEFDINLDLEFDPSALADPVTFFADQIGKAILGWLKKAWQNFVKALVWVGHEIEKVAEWVASEFNQAIDEVFKFAGEVWDDLKKVCAVVTGQDSISGNSRFTALASPAPAIALADLTTTEKGQHLLQHYYLNRDELASHLHPSTPTGREFNALLAQPDLHFSRRLEGTITAISAAAADGSNQLKTSAEAVLPLLQSADLSCYDGFLESLR